ncbi:MAG TPA: hypothetical protein VHP63_04945 [candidate division Zixibacteria bacterium]|nr:hypothetical protein [candidate division Zixibacteria bacterium]
MRREIPILITSVAGFVFAISYFIPHAPFGNAESIFGDWVSIVQAFAIWLGVLNLLKVSLERIYRKTEGWPYTYLVVASLFGTLIVGFYSGFSGINATPQYAYSDSGTGFDWVYRYVYAALTSTMFSMLAFFVGSASYRAFRARNFHATLLLLSGFLVMGGRVPLLDRVSGFFTDIPIFSNIANWIMNYPNSAGQRAILIGIALGIMSSSLRVILGIERAHIGGGK